jgi:hypothetical protein
LGCQWTKISRVDFHFEEQAHDEGWPEPFFGGIDAALDEERRSHAQRDVEWRDESQIRPISPFEN